MNRAQKHGNGAGASLDVAQWKPVIEIGHRNATTNDRVRFETSQQADGPSAEIERRRDAIGSGSAEQAARVLVSPGRRTGRSNRERRVTRTEVRVRPGINRHRARRRIRSKRFRRVLPSESERRARFATDRVAVGLRVDETPTRTNCAAPDSLRRRLATRFTGERVFRCVESGEHCLRPPDARDSEQGSRVHLASLNLAPLPGIRIVRHTDEWSRPPAIVRIRDGPVGAHSR